MSHPCPYCDGTGRAPSSDRLAELRAWCATNGHHVTPDGSVYEEAAAAILDRAPGTLRNWRVAGSPLPYFRHGRTGRVRYRLTDLAEMLADTRREV